MQDVQKMELKEDKKEVRDIYSQLANKKNEYKFCNKRPVQGLKKPSLKHETYETEVTNSVKKTTGNKPNFTIKNQELQSNNNISVNPEDDYWYQNDKNINNSNYFFNFRIKRKISKFKKKSTRTEF